MYDYSYCPNRTILCIDLRSFYASVSCIIRGLDPLKTKLAVVGDVNRPGSVVLAATPPLKKRGIKQGSRSYDVPSYPDVYKVNPSMKTYVQFSNKITRVALQYVAPQDFHQYSIDELFIDATNSIHLFAKSPRELAERIKHDIFRYTRIDCTIGIGPNPLMSKIALDIESKKNEDGIAHWTYNDIPNKLWTIQPLSKFWGISYKTEAKLNRKGIRSIGDLSRYPLESLKKEYGVVGEDLHLHSHGIDFSRISHKYTPQTTSIGKSQILMRDYTIEEIPTVILEQSEDVTFRLRNLKKLARTVQFSIGYSRDYPGGFNKSYTFDQPTNLTSEIYSTCIKHLIQRYTGEPIRTVSLSLTNLVNEGEEQLSLFTDELKRRKEILLSKTMDDIRNRFGKNSILRAASYTPSGTARYRNSLIGGHKA
ncbi:Y-family DNA polymerase [Bacillus luti]|nr:DNA repair protein [Bacillus cereus]HDR8329408.1 DNA repair protein [Bacillus cereus]HDR8335988.1 DNA repair protein [Bacillus cereus]